MFKIVKGKRASSLTRLALQSSHIGPRITPAVPESAPKSWTVPSPTSPDQHLRFRLPQAKHECHPALAVHQLVQLRPQVPVHSHQVRAERPALPERPQRILHMSLVVLSVAVQEPVVRPDGDVVGAVPRGRPAAGMGDGKAEVAVDGEAELRGEGFEAGAWIEGEGEWVV